MFCLKVLVCLIKFPISRPLVNLHHLQVSNLTIKPR